MKNIEMLKLGVKEISINHDCSFNWGEFYHAFEGYFTYVFCVENANVPCTADLEFLLKELGINAENTCVNGPNFQIFVPYDWVAEKGEEEYVEPIGGSLWRRTK